MLPLANKIFVNTGYILLVRKEPVIITENSTLVRTTRRTHVASSISRAKIASRTIGLWLTSEKSKGWSF